MNPAKVESRYDGASAVPRDREPKGIESVIGVDPGPVIRTKTRCEDDCSESRQIDAVGELANVISGHVKTLMNRVDATMRSGSSSTGPLTESVSHTSTSAPSARSRSASCSEL